MHNLRKKEKKISRVSQKCWWIQVILICMLMKIRRQWKKSNLLSWSTRSCSTPKTWYIKGAAENWMCKCHQYRAKTHANMTASYEQWQKWMWNYILTYKSNLTEILWIKTTQKRVHWCIKQMQRKKDAFHVNFNKIRKEKTWSVVFCLLICDFTLVFPYI